MTVRGIRGATSVTENTKESILKETKRLINQMMDVNNIAIEDIASIFFSVTQDLNAVFPAVAARELDMVNTPLLCLNEVNVPDSLKYCIRILMHVNDDRPQIDMKHVYLNEAIRLRPEFKGD